MSATPAQLSDLQSNIDFAKSVMAEFKQRNINDGINGAQAMWMHQRFKSWDYTFSGIAFNADIVNMAIAGDIQTCCLALIYGTADDMSLPQHWLNSARLAWLVAQMKSFLGWP